MNAPINPVPDIELARLAQAINVAVKAATEASQNAVLRGIEAGKALNEAKKKVEHGAWGKWLKDNCQLSERSAQRYMRLALNEAKLKSANMADLTIAGAEELLGPETDTGAGETGSGSSRSTPTAAQSYDKAEEKLIKKLQDLDPKEVADHAEATIKKLRETVAIMTKALKKAA